MAAVIYNQEPFKDKPLSWGAIIIVVLSIGALATAVNIQLNVYEYYRHQVDSFDPTEYPSLTTCEYLGGGANRCRMVPSKEHQTADEYHQAVRDDMAQRVEEEKAEEARQEKQDKIWHDWCAAHPVSTLDFETYQKCVNTN